MAGEVMFFRDIDLPPVVVWDALIDDVLVEGWLAPATIEARIGGRYRLDWAHAGRESTVGVITELETASRLTIATDNLGTLDFSLASIAGVRRDGTALQLTLSADADRGSLAYLTAHWRSNFDQLEELLRGHPVNWATWPEKHGAVFAQYLREASASELG